MEEAYLLRHPGVKKKILHGGWGPLPCFPAGTKTLKDNFERTVIDDSRKTKQPMEIFVGKMFKMEVWEVLLTSMRVGEVSEFWCDATHTGLYPIVSRGMRLAAQGRDPLEGQEHTCGMGNMFTYGCSGFPELDQLMKEPQPLIFIIELITVGEPCSYKQDSWMMDKDEKLRVIPSLHEQGNTLVRQGQFHEAASKYQEAILLLRTVQSREMPGHDDYVSLEHLITPLVLNYCQCKLELKEFYEVLEHTTELLEKNKGNVKAYYKRAQAHAAVWNEKEAREDFLTVTKLDVTLVPLVHQELRLLTDRMKEKYCEEKRSYWGILTKKGQPTDECKVRAASQGEEASSPSVKEELRAEPKKEESRAEPKKEETRAEPEKEETRAQQKKEETRAEQKKEEKQAELKKEITNTGDIIDVREENAWESCHATSSQRDSKNWQDMLRLTLLLQDEGNFLIKRQSYTEAAEKYKEAIEYINVLQDEVSCNRDDWESLEKVRLPLTLNLSQCLLELGEYEKVLEQNKKVLKKHRGNLKAVYQKGRAHAALHQKDEAQRHFAQVAKLDPKFGPIVHLELKNMAESIWTKHCQEKTNWAFRGNVAQCEKGKLDKREWEEKTQEIKDADIHISSREQSGITSERRRAGEPHIYRASGKTRNKNISNSNNNAPWTSPKKSLLPSPSANGNTEAIGSEANKSTESVGSEANGSTESVCSVAGGSTEALSGAAGGSTEAVGGAAGGSTEAVGGAAGGSTEVLGGAAGGSTEALAGAAGGSTEEIARSLTWSE